jgi:hypothetical protein
MPNEPRAQVPAETPGCDCHENIPKDANGNPVFLILPPHDRARYEEWMAEYEQAWRTTKDPIYFRAASTVNFIHRQPQPRWLYEAGDEIAAGRRTKRHEQRYLDALRHCLRYETVSHLRAEGLTLEEALTKAGEKLERMGLAASRYTIEDSYDRMVREIRASRYVSPTMPKHLRIILDR